MVGIQKKGRVLLHSWRQHLEHSHSAIGSEAAVSQSLTTAVQGGRAFGPPLCGGCAPATPPALQHAWTAGCRHWSQVSNGKRCANPHPASPVKFLYVQALGLPSLHIQLADATMRLGLEPALRPSKSRETTSATVGTQPQPNCSHPKPGMHPLNRVHPVLLSS